MKVCITEHVNPKFSNNPIPVGSLWSDDSPFLVAAGCFADVDDEKPPAPVRPPVRKFAAKKFAAPDSEEN